ncbi:GntR family transcriptional regulator [Streptomyces sp. J2-1]|uniref:GntR family transcriptional regulator n=1 Tax=Streptomyces corallincola TaxID=2851888 RepID=UPI001C390134|nr:GntR family transcriptional regulator [Streptomyces corallincola]MBV2352940.1 GntR family transcriptional regulator [Streptomyces corallincola]
MARTTPRNSPARTTPHHLPAHPVPYDPHGPLETPLYRRVASLLLDEVRAGAVPPGERLPGERDLARRYAVSRETVRQALDVLRRGGLVATDRRGSHVTLSGAPLEDPVSLTFPVGARSAELGAVDRATVAWEEPPPEHAAALDLAPRSPTLVHRYRSATPDGRSLRTAVTSFSAVALAEVAELGRYRDRADGATPAQLRRAYDWMRRAGLTLHHRDAITQIGAASSVRVTRRVHDQHARPLEITDLVVNAERDALVYEFTLPAAV